MTMTTVVTMAMMMAMMAMIKKMKKETRRQLRMKLRMKVARIKLLLLEKRRRSSMIMNTPNKSNQSLQRRTCWRYARASSPRYKST